MSALEKLFIQNKQKAINQILSKYQKKQHGIVNYLYFANREKHINKDTPDKKYINSLQNADFILPDGIALKLLYYSMYQKLLPNLNGTDFIIDFFDHLENTWKNIELVAYGTYQKYLDKACEHIQDKYSNIIILSAQNGYQDFDWSQIKKEKKQNTIKILLTGLPSPMQEKWINDNQKKIKKHKLLAFAQWGTFDFWAGREKRAPQRIRQIKGEWLWRLITKPQKNFKKVYHSLKVFKYVYFPPQKKNK